MPSKDIKSNSILFKWLLIITGTVIWSITMVKSGLLYSYGYGFWGANGHDAVWHIAVINSLSKGSLEMPLLSGFKIQNYHLGFDLFVAAVHRLTNLSVIQLYFQILPPICALLVGLLIYKFVYVFTTNKTSAWWATFFVYFGTSFGWLLGKGDSVFWSQQSLSTLINPPFAWSLIIMLLGLLSIHYRKYWLAVLCFGLLPEIKIYAGIVSFAGLALAAINNKPVRWILILSIAIALPLFFLTNGSSSGLIIFEPGWFLQTLFAPDRLDYPKFFSALTTYRQGNIWLKGFAAYSVAFIIFCLGNLGLRIFGLMSFGKSTWWEKFCLGVILSGSVIPLLFIQKGTAWNTIQFFYYVLFVTSFFAGIFVSKIIKYLSNPRSKLVFICLIILLSFPETISVLKNYLPSRPPAQVNRSEILALNHLAIQPRGVVLEPLFDRLAADKAISNPPRPLYLYESTAYVSAFTGQTSFLSDEVNLHITGYDIAERKSQIMDFWKNPTGDFLAHNNISYIYMTPGNNLDLKLIPGTNQLYNSDGYKIYSFDANIYNAVNISALQAIEMVGRLPVVKRIVSSAPDSFISIDKYDLSTKSWLIHVYLQKPSQIYSDLWINVDSHTGSIYNNSTGEPLSPLSPS